MSLPPAVPCRSRGVGSGCDEGWHGADDPVAVTTTQAHHTTALPPRVARWVNHAVGRLAALGLTPANWRWLVQIGQGRGDFYSYDRLENLVGCDIHSAEEIVPQWQHLGVGDRVRLTPDVALAVAALDPGRSLVLRGIAERAERALLTDSELMAQVDQLRRHPRIIPDL
jgi:hypothetical protein